MVPTTQNVVPKDEWTSEKVLLVLASSVYGLCGLHSQSSVQRMSLVQQPVFQLLTTLSMVCCIKVRFLVELSKLFGVTTLVCLVGHIQM